jgi:ABC-2 type transport system ATP-binding protein
MTVQQIIRFTRPFFPKWRSVLERRYMDMFDLPPNRKISALSKGMRTSLMLLLAMSHGAELLILDEPIEGLDPAVIEMLLKELVALPATEGTTIFFSSHQLAEVEQIADHVAIIDRGRRVVGGALDDLKVQYQRLRVVFEREPRPISWLPAFGQASPLQTHRLPWSQLTLSMISAAILYVAAVLMVRSREY